MSKTKQVQEGLLKEVLDKDLVVLKVSMINSDNQEVKVNHHLEMYLRNLRSSLVEAKVEDRRKGHKQAKVKI